MPMTLGKIIISEKSVRTVFTFGLAFTSLVAVSVPSSARDGGQIAVDIIGAIGKAAQPQAAPQPKVKYVPVPVYVQHPSHAPQHCWYEGREVFDGQDYVHRKVKVCRPDASHQHAPQHCWYEGREVFDGQDYVHRKVKVCH